MSGDQHPERSLTKGSLAVLVAVLAAAVFAAGCGGGGEQGAQEEAQDIPATGEQTGMEEQTAMETTIGETTAQDGNGETQAGNGDTAGGTGDSEGNAKDEGRSTQARLRMEGDTGTAFSGTCTLGDEENDVSGQVPATFTYELEGRKLDCKIQKEGDGNLKIVFTSGNDRSVHRTDAPDATINLTYSGKGASFSTSSTSSGGSVSQQSSSSVSSSSSSVNQQSSHSSQSSR